MKLMLLLFGFSASTPVVTFNGFSGKAYPFVWRRSLSGHALRTVPKGVSTDPETYFLPEDEKETNALLRDIFTSHYLSASYRIVPVLVPEPAADRAVSPVQEKIHSEPVAGKMPERPSAELAGLISIPAEPSAGESKVPVNFSPEPIAGLAAESAAIAEVSLPEGERAEHPASLRQFKPDEPDKPDEPGMTKAQSEALIREYDYSEAELQRLSLPELKHLADLRLISYGGKIGEATLTERHIKWQSENYAGQQPEK